MNINYHYFVLKTLASFAGFEENDAQWIAHFSQQIDDYILNSPLLLDKEPPAFFMQNGMAHELIKNRWLFFPHTTGIGGAHTVLDKFQRNTITPFHFMPAVTLAEIENTHPINRSSYRCVDASSPEAILVNRLILDVSDRAAASHDGKTLMELGMMLHTYADTYAHCHFSGLNGWENRSYVKEAFDIFTRAPGMNEFDIIKFKVLPPIGHAEVGHAPDICSYRINMAMKETESSQMTWYQQRDNSEFFAVCSRKILEFLCKVNHRPAPEDKEWEELQSRLVDAEFVPNETDVTALIQHWHQVFPEYNYYYNKEEYFKLNLTLGQSSDDMIGGLDVSEQDVLDIYSEKGSEARSGCILFVTEVDQAFFDYNELAYRRVMEVTGSYGLSLTEDELKLYQNAVSAYTNSN